MIARDAWNLIGSHRVAASSYSPYATPISPMAPNSVNPET